MALNHKQVMSIVRQTRAKRLRVLLQRQAEALKLIRRVIADINSDGPGADDVFRGIA